MEQRFTQHIALNENMADKPGFVIRGHIFTTDAQLFMSSLKNAAHHKA